MAKILFIITKSVWGGAQRYVFDLATNIPSEKFQIAVALGGNGPLKNRLESSDIEVISLQSLARDISILKDLRAFWEIIKILKRERPEIIHLNSSKIGLLGALAGRIERVPKIIFTAHGWAFNEPRPFAIRAILKFLSWLTCVLATDIIVLSDREKNQTDGFPFIKNKIHKIYLGISPQTLMTRDEARRAIAKKLSKPDDLFGDKIIIGSIGELHHNKNYECAIRAFAAMSRESQEKSLFVIIGDGEEKNKLADLVKNLKLEDKIYFTGFVKNATRILPAFDIFTLPSLKEGLPYVLLEAGLANLPVVATNVGGIPEIIDGNRSGLLISPGDTAGLQMSLDILVKDSVIRNAMGQNIHKRVIAVFDLAKMLKETLALYEGA